MVEHHRSGASSAPLLADERSDERPGRLRLTVQGNRWLDDAAAPQVRLDGHPVATHYGDNVLQVPAGHLDVQVLRRGASARLAVHVPAGATVDLWYAGPHHARGAGSLGHEPQQRTGVLPVLGLVLLAVNVAFLLGHLLLG